MGQVYVILSAIEQVPAPIAHRVVSQRFLDEVVLHLHHEICHRWGSPTP